MFLLTQLIQLRRIGSTRRYDTSNSLTFICFPFKDSAAHGQLFRSHSIPATMNLLFLTSYLLLLVSTSSFVPSNTRSNNCKRSLQWTHGMTRSIQSQGCGRQTTQLFESSDGGRVEEMGAPEDPVADEKVVDENVVSSATSVEAESNPYPIDLPSPILLATSMILAIAGTGSVFELLGGDPQFGPEVTAAIAAVGIPLALFLFYASILKATAETEADDKVYTKGN